MDTDIDAVKAQFLMYVQHQIDITHVPKYHRKTKIIMRRLCFNGIIIITILITSKFDNEYQMQMCVQLLVMMGKVCQRGKQVEDCEDDIHNVL